MKKVSLMLMLGIAVAAVAAINPIEWKTTVLDIGEVKAGETQDLAFEFTNRSTVPVTILEAKGSCGCTNVVHPESEIAPGETASISAKFKSSSAGSFNKNIRIKTSASEEFTYLYFKGAVLK